MLHDLRTLDLQSIQVYGIQLIVGCYAVSGDASVDDAKSALEDAYGI
jgi:hypothetical protein